MSPRDKDPFDAWGGDSPLDRGCAFEGQSSRERQITLTLSIPPLQLPGEDGLRTHESGRAANANAAMSSVSVPVDPAHFDGWTVDRLRRSSLPPSAAQTISGLPPPASVRYALGEERDGVFDGDALALVSRARPTPMLDLVSEMAERFALGDFSGALRASELLLGQDPRDHLAQHYARESREKLDAMYTSRLAAQGRVPVVAVPETDIRWLGLDPQVGFLLSRVDGVSDYEVIIDISGMPRLEALRALIELVDARVVRLV